MDPLLRSLIRLESALGSLTGPAADVARAEAAELRGLIYRPADASGAEGASAAYLECQRALDVLIDNVPGMVYRSRNDRHWTLEYVSPGCLALTGYAPAELVDNRVVAFGDLIVEAHRERVWETVQRAVHEDRPFDVEYAVRVRDGAERWVRERGRGVRDGESLDAIEGYIADITDEMEVRGALRRSEAYFRALTEHAGDVLTVLDLAGRVVYKSPAVRRELGWDPAELVGQDIFAFVHPDSVAPVRAAFERAVRGPGIPVPVELEFRQADGTWAVLEATLTSLLDDPAVGGVVANSRNISSRRRAELGLQRALRTLEALVQNAPVAIMAVDREFIVRMWNPAAESALGWTAAEVIGRPYPLVPAGHESEFEALRRRVFAETESLHGIELRRQRKDGTLLDILLHSMVIGGTDGEPDLAVGFFLDVTERNQLESALRQSQKMDAVGRLAGGVAHDFNNLLTVIKGSVGMALLEAGGAGALREDLQEIDRTADRATALTRQLLAFSRQQVVHPEVLELGPVVEQLEPMLRRLIGEDVSLRVRAEPGRVLADRSQIEQVLMNLAVNARDAMPEGGDLLITVQPAAFPAGPAEGGPRAAEGSAAMRLTVSDTGIGMDARTLQQIFEPFFTTKAPGRGTGLGLSMVYGIVRQNGGLITVDSEPGAGTTVSIHLPATARAAAAPGELAPPEVPSGGDARVMVVEDEPALRALARRVLMGAGYQVLTAEHGADALERLAEAGGVDLVLTDVVMPVMGGRELVDRLRERTGAPAVLYMSGYAESEIVHRGVLRDGSRLLEKPFTPAELLEAVRATLDEARRAR